MLRRPHRTYLEHQRLPGPGTQVPESQCRTRSCYAGQLQPRLQVCPCHNRTVTTKQFICVSECLLNTSFDYRAFITWLANGDAIRIFKMIKKDDGTFNFKAASEDFPQKHKAPILNIGIAETGTKQ